MKPLIPDLLEYDISVRVKYDGNVKCCGGKNGKIKLLLLELLLLKKGHLGLRNACCVEQDHIGNIQCTRELK